jgi:hypothetical protein
MVVGVLAVLLLVVLAASCTVREELVIDGDGAGEAVVEIVLSPVLLAYYNDLLVAMTGVEGEYPVFDLDQIAASFAERPGLTITSIERPARGQLRMEFRFDDINDVLENEADNGTGPVAATEVVEFRSSGGQRELIMHLNREAVDSFLAFAPPESATMTQFLFPPADGSVSEEEYRGELGWALEEYAPADEVDALLRNSAIEVVVRPVGRVLSQSGGTLRGGVVTFRVPVLELLTLSEEREYRLVFAP